MADDNLSADAGPVTDDSAPLNMSSAVAGLTDILKDDPTPDPVAENEDTEQAAADEGAEPEQEAEDVEAATAEDEDGSEEPEVKGGRFAPDTAKVTLDDGTVTTVGELRRNTLFQRDYTKKTTELKAEREAFQSERQTFEQERQKVSEYAQQLDQSREYLAWYAEQFVPKQPEAFKGNPADDPMGYMQWQHANNQWLNHVQAYQAFQQQRQQGDQLKAGETQKQQQERLQRERDALVTSWPVLKDPVKGKQAWDGLVSSAQQHFGLTAEEVNSVADHRMIQILRDALEYRKVKAAAPNVKAQVRKPAMQDAPRPAQQRPNADRAAQSERFNKSRSLDDAAALLRNLIS